MFHLIPGIGAFFWPLLCLLLATGIRLPKVTRAPALYAGLLSLVAIYVPLWHTLSSPNRMEVEYLIPTLRGDSLNFLTMLFASLLFFQTRGLSLRWVIRGMGWALFAFILCFGRSSVQMLYGFENPSLSAFFVLLALGVESWETAVCTLGVSLYLHSWTTALAWVAGMGMTHGNLWWDEKRSRPLRWFGIALPLCGVAAVVYFQSHSFDRLDYWSKTWMLYRQLHWAHWVFGAGPGCFIPWSQAYQGIELLWKGLLSTFTHVHNDYFQIIFDFGWVGAALIFYAMVKIYRMAGKTTRVHLMMLLVSMTIYFPLHFVPTLILAIFWVREALYEIR